MIGLTAGNNKNAGFARVTKLSIVLLDRLQPKNMSGAYFAKGSDFGNYKDNTRARLTARDEGLVTIVDLDYLPGSANDEAMITDKVRKESEGDGYRETTAGQTISACRNPWNELLAPADFHAKLLSGALKSYFRMGDLNCLVHGQTVEIKSDRSGASAGKVTVLKVKKFRLSFINASYFPAGDFAQLEAAIKAEKPNEWITVVEVQP